jgi:hypothetical protein
MARYYFDYRDNDQFFPDGVGSDLSSVEAVKREATRALTELARDVLPGSAVRTLSIEVRTESGPVLRASLRFEIEQTA